MSIDRHGLAKRHEEYVASVIPGGAVTLASGAVLEKRDVDVQRDGTSFRPLVECKCTTSASYSVTQKLWSEIVEDTYNRSSEMRPSLATRFYGPFRQVQSTEVLADLITLDLNDFAELLVVLHELRAEVERLRGELGSR